MVLLAVLAAATSYIILKIWGSLGTSCWSAPRATSLQQDMPRLETQMAALRLGLGEATLEKSRCLTMVKAAVEDRADALR
ncbi:unnamed protein product, partial [Ascophyllum nodosum]